MNAVVTDLYLSFPCREKVFSHVLLERLQPLLQMTQRPQQSGFTAGRSTIDALLVLQLLSELRRQLKRPLYVVFVNIIPAFHSVDRNALWKALRARGIPDILLNLIEDLHTHTGATVGIGNKFCHRFSTTSGVRPGCVLAPTLFLVAIDWILGHLTPEVDITVGHYHFPDLAYADDAAILMSDHLQADSVLQSFNAFAAPLG